MLVLLKIIALTVLLLLVQEALRRATPWAVWGIFLLLPLVLTPYWIQINELGLFSWFKFYTVFFCVCWGVALRFTSLGDRAWIRCTIPLLLAINIFEATAVDLLAHGPAHTLNAVAGLLLIATQPYGQASTKIDAASSSRDLLYGTSRQWVIGYTFWNWTFVYLNYPALTGHHTAVLAAGLIVAMLAPERWSQTRASTLGANLLVTATAYKGMVAWLDTSTWFNDQLAILAAGISLAFMIGCLITAVAARPWLSQLNEPYPTAIRSTSQSPRNERGSPAPPSNARSHEKTNVDDHSAGKEFQPCRARRQPPLTQSNPSEHTGTKSSKGSSPRAHRMPSSRYQSGAYQTLWSKTRLLQRPRPAASAQFAPSYP
jgi:hypothetical protein